MRNWLGKVRARDKSVPGIDDIDIFSNYTPLMLACGANNIDVIKHVLYVKHCGSKKTWRWGHYFR